ncbi:hypothetical protein RRF57_010078 [Xylaria bambusicola]|uniref:Uncharacterized protein n=1 Tax=Xylaria bambusicola TaxID=326684 RepID=A0AAN7V0D6_9PEZI
MALTGLNSRDCFEWRVPAVLVERIANRTGQGDVLYFLLKDTINARTAIGATVAAAKVRSNFARLRGTYPAQTML